MNIIYKILRKLCKIPQPVISTEQAVTHFRRQCAEEGIDWDLLEPVIVKERLRSYWIKTNTDCKGGCIIADIDFISGRLIKKVDIPR